MDSLRNYLNSMPRSEQELFAANCRTSLGYLRKAISTKQQLGIELVVRLHKQSQGAVKASDVRPDVDWSEFIYVLPSSSPEEAA